MFNRSHASFFKNFALGTILSSSLLIPATTNTLYAQTATTGAIAGVVTDSTGAILPNATITITDTGSGAVITAKSDPSGHYAANLLKPGNYTVSAFNPSFTSNVINVAVELSQTIPVNIKMVPAGTTASVDVSAAQVPLLDTQNIALVTTFDEAQIENLPAPGGDVTTVAFALPGVVVNAGGEYGNFSSNGLPGVSNLFVLNGFDNVDPFLNLNNSGSSNLTLGQGELQEASVVQNAYNSQFGRAAGAIIFYTTKSGTNHFHGSASYFGNTSVMNANSWFGNYNGAARPHAVSNEFAANVGGPIVKDRLFFFADYEGLRYVLPGANGLINFPTPQLQAYTLATLPSAAVSLYKQAFAAYQSAPSYATAKPVTTGPGEQQDASGQLGCGNLSGTPTGTGGGVFGVNVPCVQTAFASANNINKEWLFTGRVDYTISPKHHVYARYKVDHGSQPTSTSAINPLFSAVSIQPEDEGQLNDNYQITPTMTNSFTMASNWYSAYFGPVNPTASAALYPDNLYADLGIDGSGTNVSGGLTSIGVPYYLTQGRDVTQYQFEDDWTYLRGKNTYKAGFNFRRDLVSDYDQQIETVFPAAFFGGLGDYVQGQFSANQQFYLSGADFFQQAFSNIQHAHIDLYNIGIYAQDELQVIPTLKLTIGARIDRTGDPKCNDNCFSQYNGNIPAGVLSSDSTGGFNSPYNAAKGGPISASNQHPFPSVQPVNFQARFGFNYSPEPKTEIRGGFGMFSDLYPAGFLDNAIQNFPNYDPVTVQASGIYGAGSGAGTVRNDAAAGNAAIQSGFKNGQTITQINTTLTNAGIPFTPPSLGAYFPGEFKVPEYLEFSLQIQHQIGRYDSVNITYAGNRGYDLVLTNPFANPGSGLYDNASGSWYLQNGYTYGGYAATPSDPRFSRITAYTNNGYSNYNGLQMTYKHNGHGIEAQFNYTWSHALDTISNGGEGEPFNGGSLGGQLTPSLKYDNLNYSNADYDVRNNFSGDLSYIEPMKFNSFLMNEVAGGWTIGLKSYARSGEPFSVINALAFEGFSNLGTSAMPDAIADPTNTCVHGPKQAILNPCLQSQNFANFGPGNTQTGYQTDFGNVRRNSFYGPHYFDTDVHLTKALIKTEGIKFVLGANAFNIFNHANFANPSGSLGLNGFGQITGTLAPPTSPYGSFQGAAVTQRVVQIEGKLSF